MCLLILSDFILSSHTLFSSSLNASSHIWMSGHAAPGQGNQNELIFMKLKSAILISKLQYASENFFTINKFWKAVFWINPTALQCGEMGVSKQTRESQFVETWDIPNRGGYDTQSGSWRPNQEFKVGGVGWGNLWSHWELLNRHVWSNLCLRKHLRKLDIVMHACL